MMQAAANTQCTPDTTPCSSDEESSSSSSSTPSLCASESPSSHPSDILANNCANGNKLRSRVWSHFIQAADYKTSKQSTCVHCGKTFKSHYGSTSSLNQHLKKHPDVLDTPDYVETLGR
jgi:hypothetical protein